MDNNRSESQFELFSSTTPSNTNKPLKISPFKHLTVTAENIILLGILWVIIVVVAFSFGVERGKRVALRSLQDIRKTELLFETTEPLKEPAIRIKTTEPGKPSQETIAMKAAAIGAGESQEDDSLVALSIPSQESKGYYTIQVASYKSESYAQKEAEAAQAQYGQEAFIAVKGKYTALFIGRFSQKRDAETLLTKLRKKYKDCFVRSI